MRVIMQAQCPVSGLNSSLGFPRLLTFISQEGIVSVCDLVDTKKALQRLKQEDHQFKASLDNIARHSSKNKTKKLPGKTVQDCNPINWRS
jgi:hypothetical protein